VLGCQCDRRLGGSFFRRLRCDRRFCCARLFRNPGGGGSLDGLLGSTLLIGGPGFRGGERGFRHGATVLGMRCFGSRFRRALFLGSVRGGG